MVGQKMSVVLLQTAMFLLMAATVMPQPTASYTPPIGGELPPVDGQLPPGGGYFPPDQGSDPPLDPWIDLIPPFIPGIGSIPLPQRKCVGRCNSQCMKSKSPFAGVYCLNICFLKCGIRMSNVVYGCAKSCIDSGALIRISDDREAKEFLNFCFEHCKSN